MPEPRNDRSDPASGLWVALGPALFLGILLLPRPEGLTADGHATLALTAWMAAWWLTVAVELAVTALLPLALLPALGIADPGAAAAPYANPVIFLFMGGFFIAAAMRRWNLHRRVALGVVARTGTSPRRLVGGFMLANALLSMWMSNTAATLMMMPIGAAVLSLPGLAGTERQGNSDRGSSKADDPLGVALMLGIAYAGSIGGVATLIGTPPNAVFAGLSDELLGVDVSFAGWLVIGIPIAAVMLLTTWVLLTRVLYRLSGDPLPGAAGMIRDRRSALGGWRAAERVIAGVFVLAAAAWIFRAPKEIGDLSIPGLQTLLPQVGDATIAMAAALILFLWPVRGADGERTQVLDWPTAREIPWGILVLFGGGLSLAAAFESSGLTEWLGGKLAILSGLPDVLVIAAVAALFVLLTEVTSNTATATLGLPVVAGLGPVIGVDPLPLMITAAMSASMAFMLPVATPPNAIVFGSGYIPAGAMSRAGLWLNFAAIATVTVAIAAGLGRVLIPS